MKPKRFTNLYLGIRSKFWRRKARVVTEAFTLQNGVPSHDTWDAVYWALDIKKLGECFIELTKSLVTWNNEVVAIDRKTVRGVGSNGRNGSLHIVSAFCERNRICLAQQVVENKSNEIVAIPKLQDFWTTKSSGKGIASIIEIQAKTINKKTAQQRSSKRYYQCVASRLSTDSQSNSQPLGYIE